MSFATFARNRSTERLIALLSAVAVLLGMMAIYAPPALAHHPELEANQTCVDREVVVQYTSTSWLTTGASGSGHSDIRIQARPVGGDWVQVGNGAYTAANGYSFSGTFDGSDLNGQAFWNTTIEIRAFANGQWDNNSGGNQYSSTVQVNVTQDCFNPSCPGQYLEYKVEPVSSGTFGPNDEFTINVSSTSSGQVFDWTSTVPVFQVIVKGGPGANTYDFSGAFGGSGLHAPVNPSNGSYYGLSHITFCYQQVQDQPVNVTVSGGVCEFVQGSAVGSATITIDPASGATVNVYSDAANTNLVDTLTSSGTVSGLAPGTYYWTATAADGYELTGSGSGQFVIEDCTPPPPPSGWACVDGDVVFIEDATDFDGNLYETEQDAMNDPDCTPPPPPPSGWVCQNGDVSFMEDATDFEGTLYETAEEAANDPDCVPPEVGASILVTVASTCTVNDGLGEGEIAVTVSVDGGATVTITDESGAVIGTFTSDGTLAVPEGASYTWVAVPSDGFEFPQGFEATGTLTVDTCTPDEVAAAIQVTVSGSCELDGDEGEGFIDVTLSVANGATVVVRDADGDVVGTVTDDATLSVPEGATYTWSATPNEGFEFPAGFVANGSVTIERCSDPESLPFTGFDPMGMGLFAILLVGAGITAIYKAPREEGA